MTCQLIVAACVALVACTERDRDLTITDSSGVRLVTNRADGEGWFMTPRMTVTEDLTIGADSLPEYQFGRIGDLDVAQNGDIAVIDQLGGVVRVYNDSGRYLRSIGRSGQGPGELSRSANGISFIGGDSLLLLDPGERRKTTFAPNGTVGAVTPLPPGPTGQGWTRLTSGDFLMRGLTISRADGKFTFWDALLGVRADTAVSDTLFEFDYVKTDMGGPPRIRIQLIVNNPTWARLSDGRIAWTALDRNYVQVHDSTGKIVARITHAQWVPKEIAPADKAAMVELLRTKLQAIGGDASFPGHHRGARRSGWHDLGAANGTGGIDRPDGDQRARPRRFPGRRDVACARLDRSFPWGDRVAQAVSHFSSEGPYALRRGA